MSKKIVIKADFIPPLPVELADEFDELASLKLNGPANLVEKMRLVYGFIDKVNRGFVSTFTTCGKGCSHCCRMDVQLSCFEAEYIFLATGIQHVPYSKLTTGHKTPCPFLSECGLCMIYEYRPLFCRTYHSVSDPELCGIEDAAVAQYGTADSGMGNYIYRSIHDWIHFQNVHATGGNIKDIRDYFPHDPIAMRQHISKS